MEPQPATLPKSSRAEPLILGLVVAWSFLLIISSRLGIASSTWLIVSGALFLAAVTALLVRTKSVSLPLLLPGLLIFFKQNDSLSSLLWDAPVVDLLALAVAATLLVSLGRERFISTLSDGALIFILLCILLMAMIVSSKNAVDVLHSGKEVTTFAKDMIFACLIAFSVRNTDDLLHCLNWIIFAASFSAAIMVFDAWNGSVLLPTGEDATWQGSIRSSGASSESVPDAATMVLSGALSASILALRSPTGRAVYLFAALLGVTAIMASITRSALAAGVLAIFYLLWRLRKERFFAGAAVFFAMVIACIVLLMPQAMISKITALGQSTEDRTISRRVSYQEIGFDLFRSAPFIGIGAGNYADRFASDEFRFVTGRGTEPRPLHNVYLQYFVETGVLGGFAFLALVATIWRTYSRACHSRSNVLKYSSEALLLMHFSLCVQLFFLSSKSFLGFWILAAMAIVVARLWAEEQS